MPRGGLIGRIDRVMLCLVPTECNRLQRLTTNRPARRHCAWPSKACPRWEAGCVPASASSDCKLMPCAGTATPIEVVHGRRDCSSDVGRHRSSWGSLACPGAQSGAMSVVQWSCSME